MEQPSINSQSSSCRLCLIKRLKIAGWNAFALQILETVQPNRHGTLTVFNIFRAPEQTIKSHYRFQPLIILN